MREARVLSALDHPNICRIHDYVERPDGDILVLELIEGVTLEAAVEQGMSRARKLRIAIEIADALAAAHRKGIVHRDLKPENVMITAEGAAKILDFGVARRQGDGSPAEEPLPPDENAIHHARTLLYPSDAGDSAGDGAVTYEGWAIGTPGAMSPEQARGQVTTPASDLYAFGLLLQTLFSEKPAHPEDLGPRELMARAGAGITEPMSGQPRDITALINRLKSYAPADRPTALETLQILRQIVSAPARRIRFAAAAVLIVFVILAAVKYVADVTAARREAEQQRRQAEQLVSFIVGDLRQKLEGVGRLDVLDAAATKALAYFASLHAEDLSGNDLHRHALALAQLGEVRVEQGKLDEAVKLFQQSHRFASAAVARDPMNEEWQLALSNAHFWLGDALRRKEDHAGTLVHFRAYLAIAQRLAARHPGNAAYEKEVGYGHANVGAAHEAAGNLDPALREYGAAVAIGRRGLARDPRNAQWQEDLASFLNLAGALQQKRGDLGAAQALLEEELLLQRALAAAAPNDARRLRTLATTLAFLGQVHKKRNDVERAKKAYREELAISAALAKLDPSKLSARRNEAAAESRLGELMTGDVPAGLALLEHAVATLEAVVAADDRPGWRRDLATAHERQKALRQLAAATPAPRHKPPPRMRRG
jgi:tetratricopeptide (TPR) repeat protein